MNEHVTKEEFLQTFDLFHRGITILLYELANQIDTIQCPIPDMNECTLQDYFKWFRSTEKMMDGWSSQGLRDTF